MGGITSGCSGQASTLAADPSVMPLRNIKNMIKYIFAELILLSCNDIQSVKSSEVKMIHDFVTNSVNVKNTDRKYGNSRVIINLYNMIAYNNKSKMYIDHRMDLRHSSNISVIYNIFGEPYISTPKEYASGYVYVFNYQGIIITIWNSFDQHFLIEFESNNINPNEITIIPNIKNKSIKEIKNILSNNMMENIIIKNGYVEKILISGYK